MAVEVVTPEEYISDQPNEKVMELVSGVGKVLSGNLTSIELDGNYSEAFVEDMMNAFNEKMIGHHEVKEALARDILKLLIQTRKRQGPLGIYLVNGLSGVGKSMLAKVLGFVTLGSMEAITKIDCTGLTRAHKLSDIVGGSKDHTGYGEPTPLADTELYKHYNAALQLGLLHPILRDPKFKNFSIVLLDEFEKAHVEVQTGFLSMWQDGYHEFSTGKEDNPDIKFSKRTDLSNTIFIATGNVGLKTLQDISKQKVIGFGREKEEVNKGSVIENEIKESFPLELFNRIRKTFICEELSIDELKEIIDLNLSEYNWELGGTFNKFGFCFELEDNVYDYILDNCDYKNAQGRGVYDFFTDNIEEYFDNLKAEFKEAQPYLNLKGDEGLKVIVYVQDGELRNRVVKDEDFDKKDLENNVKQLKESLLYQRTLNNIPGNGTEIREGYTLVPLINDSYIETNLVFFYTVYEYCLLKEFKKQSGLGICDQVNAILRDLSKFGITEKDLDTIETSIKDGSYERLYKKDFYHFDSTKDYELFFPISQSNLKGIIGLYVLEQIEKGVNDKIYMIELVINLVKDLINISSVNDSLLESQITFVANITRKFFNQGVKGKLDKHLAPLKNKHTGWLVDEENKTILTYDHVLSMVEEYHMLNNYFTVTGFKFKERLNQIKQSLIKCELSATTISEIVSDKFDFGDYAITAMKDYDYKSMENNDNLFGILSDRTVIHLVKRIIKPKYRSMSKNRKEFKDKVQELKILVLDLMKFSAQSIFKDGQIIINFDTLTTEQEKALDKKIHNVCKGKTK